MTIFISVDGCYLLWWQEHSEEGAGDTTSRWEELLWSSLLFRCHDQRLAALLKLLSTLPCAIINCTVQLDILLCAALIVKMFHVCFFVPGSKQCEGRGHVQYGNTSPVQRSLILLDTDPRIFIWLKISAGWVSKCHRVCMSFPKGGLQNDLFFIFSWNSNEF